MTDEQAERMIVLLARIVQGLSHPVQQYAPQDPYRLHQTMPVPYGGFNGVAADSPHWLLCNQAMAGG